MVICIHIVTETEREGKDKKVIKKVKDKNLRLLNEERLQSIKVFLLKFQ